MRARRTAFTAMAALVLLTAATEAQWLDYPTPGIPRLADGRPNLSAPTPRTTDGRPDLSGIWSVGNMDYYFDLAKGLQPGDVQLTPWAAGIQKQRMDRDHVDDPYGYCLPLGVPRINLRSEFKIVQTPLLTAFLYEAYVGTMFRQVFTDGRPLPDARDSGPTWLGYSVGRWEDDYTFVVQTIGMDERTWLDNAGNSHSFELRVEERYRRVNWDTLELTVTIDDPKAYTKPWVPRNRLPLKLMSPDTDLMDWICALSEAAAYKKVVDTYTSSAVPQEGHPWAPASAGPR